MKEAPKSPFAVVGGRIIVNVQAPIACPPHEWDEYLTVLEGLDLSQATYVSFTDGSIDARQRQTLSMVIGARRFHRSIVTSSSATSSVVTAVSWLSPGARAFSPKEIDSALNHARINEGLRSEFWSSVQSLHEAMRIQDRPAWLSGLIEDGLLPRAYPAQAR